MSLSELSDDKKNRIDERQKARYNGSLYMDKIYTITRKIKPKIIVELGRYVGDSTFAFLSAIENNSNSGFIYSIDIVEPNKIIVDDVNRFNWNKNIEMITSDALDFADIWKNNHGSRSIDLLYIDDDHSYDHVKNELYKWIPNVKSGGTILMDDFLGPPPDDVWRALLDVIRNNILSFSKIEIIPTETQKEWTQRSIGIMVVI